MERTVTCSCGQRNKLDSYGFGEPRICIACGRLLSPPRDVLPVAPDYKEEAIPPPLVTGFEEEQPGDGAMETGFETPSGEVDLTSEESPGVVVWEGRIREMTTDAPEGHCARCKTPFRGDWDRNERPGGALCHRCATQADPDYSPPTPEARRELYRPAPPRKLPQESQKDTEEWAKKKRGLLMLGGIAAVVLVLINVLPVEVWVAQFFSADLDAAQTLSPAWNRVVRVCNFGVSAFAYGASVYITLSLCNLLYDGGWRNNIGSVAYLGVAFALLNMFVAFAMKYFGMFGPMAWILVTLAIVVAIMIQLLMIAGQFPLRLESGVSFFLAWIVVSLLLKPCVTALGQLVRGIVAAIAL